MIRTDINLQSYNGLCRSYYEVKDPPRSASDCLTINIAFPWSTPLSPATSRYIMHHGKTLATVGSRSAWLLL